MGSVTQASPSPSPVPARVIPPRRPEYDLTVATEGSSWVRVVAAAGPVDQRTAAELADHLCAALAEETLLVVVDLRRVDFLAAAGLSVLVAADQRARAQGTTLRVVAGTHAVARALTVIGLTPTLRVYSDLAPALAL